MMATFDALLLVSTLLFINNIAGLQFDCSNYNDGLYAIGCRNVFIRCHMGRTYNLSCPADLKFNPKNGKCEYTKQIALCTNPMRNSNKIIKAAEPFDCSSRVDGVYGTGRCSKHYISCYEGTATEMPCPPNLYFNSKTKGCDRKENVRECDRYRATHGRRISYSMEYSYHDAETLSHQHHLQSPDFSCDNKVNGIYAARPGQCIDWFWLCADSRPFKFDCPSGLFFNRQTKQCDYKTLIPECNDGQPVVAPPTPAIAMQQVAFDCSGKADGFYDVETCNDVMVQCSGGVKLQQRCPSGLVFSKYSKTCEYPHVCLSHSETLDEQEDYGVHVYRYDRHFDCANKADGQYAHGYCKPTFMLCSNGNAHEQNCPAGLVYSQWVGACDYDDNCRRWSPQRRPPPRPIITTEMPSCLNLAHGAHALDSCSPNYFLCFAGTASLASCPSDLIFSPSSEQCDIPRNVQSCHGSVENSQETVPMIPPAQPPIAVTQPPPVAAAPELDNFCAMKQDSLYTAGCESYFYSCNAHKAYRLYCPQGLYFDANEKKCDIRENVDECKSQEPEEVPPALEPAQSPAMPEFDCTGKADGYYSMGCSSSYYACTGGVMNIFECPSNLKYDLDAQKCNYQDQVAVCGGMPTQAQSPPIVPQQPQQPSTNDITKQFCLARPDGVYADGCGPRYFICASRTTFTYYCPLGQVFNGRVASCDLPSNVPQCPH
uniref:Chondroitin proteoglycan-2 n=1 Tax=Ascaris suum TaxID=6253 RepID=F1KXX9_ASCSU